jgi:riboflavin biosynthesis pyrimidine reductase
LRAFSTDLDPAENMAMKPQVIILMLTSPDGSLHPSRWTRSPDGTKDDWSAIYESVHANLAGDAWMVGRVTMAEISKSGPHPPKTASVVPRPVHLSKSRSGKYAIAIDRTGKLHFSGNELYGDHVVVLLGAGVSDSHLAELAADGVSYIVSDRADVNVAHALHLLNTELGIERIILEGGASINGSFLALGLVDEINFVMAPALEARCGSDRVVEYGPDGLSGKVELSLLKCEPLSHGAVLLRYRAIRPE